MSGYNVILVSDTSDYPRWIRDYGLHRLASHVRENGYTCLVVNFCSEMTWEHWNDICKYAVGSDTLVLGFGTTWWPYKKPFRDNSKVSRFLDLFPKTTPEEIFPDGGILYDIIVHNDLKKWTDVAKNINPKIKIIMGGAKIDNYTDLKVVDNFFVGLSETQICDYLESLKGKKRLWPTFIEHDSTAQGSGWDFKFSKTSYIEEDLLKNGEYVSVEFARGCRFKCNFCAYPLIGRKDVSNYLKDSETLYSEFMENYEKWGITSYRVADDTLNDSVEKLQYLLDVVKRLPFKPNFRAFIRLDVITVQPEQIEILKELGLISSWIGIDSMHPVASKAIGKGMEMERKKETLYKLKESWGNSIYIDCGYIVGLPGEDSNFIRELVNWVIQKDSPIDRIALPPFFLNALDILPHYPKSDMDRNYKKYGYDVPNKDEPFLWTKDDGTDIKSFLDAAKLSLELTKLMNDNLKSNNFGHMYNGLYEDPKIEYFPKLIDLLKNKFDNK